MHLSLGALLAFCPANLWNCNDSMLQGLHDGIYANLAGARHDSLSAALKALQSLQAMLLQPGEGHN